MEAGGATATSSATAKGSGSATASSTATAGVNTLNAFTSGVSATSYAETAKGGLAQAQAQAGFNVGSSQSTAKTTFGGVSVQSTVELFGGGSTEATAQGGSGQSPVNSGFDGLAFATALPNAVYATMLIGNANNVAAALLGPDDRIFGTAILEGGGTSTFDFSFSGDVILGEVDNDSVVNLGFFSGPVDLTLEDPGIFV